MLSQPNKVAEVIEETVAGGSNFRPWRLVSVIRNCLNKRRNGTWQR
jgi:hypothetical protein